MPVNPSSNLLQQFGIQQPQAPVGNGISGPMPVAQPLLPSWMRTGFEGGSDALMGMLGMGPDTTMNKVGQLGMAALPMAGVGLASRIKPPMQAAPQAEELGGLIQQAMGNLRQIPGGQNSIFDEAGRYLGAEPQIDPVFAQHVASSVGKFKAPPNAPLGPNYTTPNVPMGGRYEKLAPNVDQLEELLKKYKK